MVHCLHSKLRTVWSDNIPGRIRRNGRGRRRGGGREADMRWRRGGEGGEANVGGEVRHVGYGKDKEIGR